MKYILMVLVLILLVGGGAVSGNGDEREMIESDINLYLDACYSTLSYGNEDRLLKWGNRISVRMIGLPDYLVPVYHRYIKYFNKYLKKKEVSIEMMDDGVADINIILSDDLTEAAHNQGIKSLLKAHNQSNEDYTNQVSSWKDQGTIYSYRKLGGYHYFVALWNPDKYPVNSVAGKSFSFQMQKILYYTLTFVPSTTKSDELRVGGFIYSLTYFDIAYLLALYDRNIEPFSPLAIARPNILNNMVNYLLSVKVGTN